MYVYLILISSMLSSFAYAKIGDIQSGFYSDLSEESVCGMEIRYNRAAGRIGLYHATNPITGRYCSTGGQLLYSFGNCSDNFCRQQTETPYFLLTAFNANIVEIDAIDGSKSWSLEFAKKEETKPTLFDETIKFGWAWPGSLSGEKCGFKDGTTKDCDALNEADVIKNWGTVEATLTTATASTVELCHRMGNKVCTVLDSSHQIVLGQTIVNWMVIKRTGHLINVKVKGSEN